MEIHHIVPRSEGGDDSEDNGIPLCFDCHAEAHSYNPKQPMGRRIRPSELRKHKEQWFAIVARPPWSQHTVALDVDDTRDTSIAESLRQLETADLWNPDVAQRFLPRVLRLGDDQRVALIRRLSEILSTRVATDEARWNAALVVEFLIQWDPQKIPPQLLHTMTSDPFFSVRSAAAVSYYHLAGFSPDAVPVEVLGRMASVFEDWYVMTPATSALLRLARTRSVAVEVLARAISHENKDARDHAAHALERLAKADPAALRDDIADRMIGSGYPPVVQVGKVWKQIIEERQAKGEGLDYQMF
jgi:HNH endonuclease